MDVLNSHHLRGTACNGGALFPWSSVCASLENLDLTLGTALRSVGALLPADARARQCLLNSGRSNLWRRNAYTGDGHQNTAQNPGLRHDSPATKERCTPLSFRTCT